MTEKKYGVLKSGDPNTKYGKNIVFRSYDNPMHPTDPKDPKAWSMYLDERAIEGGFYFSGGMVTEPFPPISEREKGASHKHYHDYVEYIAFLGTNPDDKTDLGGEVEFYMEDEKHTFTNSCVIMVPAKTWHCPVYFNRVDRPILFYSASNAPILYAHVKRDPNDPNQNSDIAIIED